MYGHFVLYFHRIPGIRLPWDLSSAGARRLCRCIYYVFVLCLYLYLQSLDRLGPSHLALSGWSSHPQSLVYFRPVERFWSLLFAWVFTWG